jgi:copper homeostasis protein CutC
VLTSGKAETATEGEGTIREMIENAGHIKVIAAGRITSSNLEEVRDLIRASEYHGRRIV